LTTPTPQQQPATPQQIIAVLQSMGIINQQVQMQIVQQMQFMNAIQQQQFLAQLRAQILQQQQQLQLMQMQQQMAQQPLMQGMASGVPNKPTQTSTDRTFSVHTVHNFDTQFPQTRICSLFITIITTRKYCTESIHPEFLLAC